MDDATLPAIDPSNLALAGRYDEIPYNALPHRASHPARIATVAALAGHAAPQLGRCSVLEVGCNNGSNLIPMAVSMPEAHFVGCDLSPRAIEDGRRTIGALGLTNISLVEEDLAALAPEYGGFDFVIAHGVYSWVPAPVRDALLALAAERLAPDGVLYVSFNVLPGCRVRQAAWDVLHHHVDRIPDARARLDAARQIARLIAGGGSATVESDEALRAEFRAVAQRSDSEICHDDLAVPNEPVLFDTFVRHAARHGLRYLGEAGFPTLGVSTLSGEMQAFLSTLDPLAAEQYLDFVRLRRFRQSLLVRDGAPADAKTGPERLRTMHISASWELACAAGTVGIHKLARRLDPSAGGGGPVRRLLDALVADHPVAHEVASLDGRFDLRSLPRPLDSVLRDACDGGIVELHLHAPALSNRPPDRPVASPLARLQALTRDTVTTLLHIPVRIADRNALSLLPLVDGTRDRSALASAVRQLATDVPPAHAPGFVGFALEKFARLGLLMGEGK